MLLSSTHCKRDPSIHCAIKKLDSELELDSLELELDSELELLKLDSELDELELDSELDELELDSELELLELDSLELELDSLELDSSGPRIPKVCTWPPAIELQSDEDPTCTGLERGV